MAARDALIHECVFAVLALESESIDRGVDSLCLERTYYLEFQ
jgi:hypothetical protein